MDHILLLKPFNVDAAVVRTKSRKLLVSNIKGTGVNTIISYKDLRTAIGILRTYKPTVKMMLKTAKKEKERILARKAKTAAAAAAGNAIALLLTKGKVTPDADAIPEQQISLRITTLAFSLLNDANPQYITPLLKLDIAMVDNQIQATAGSVSTPSYTILIL